MQSFDDVLFTMTSFSAKKSKKKFAGWGKKSKNIKWPQKFLNYVLQWYLIDDQNNLCLFLKSGY